MVGDRYGLDHARGRHRPGLPEVRRAEDRDVGDCARVVDQVADPHDLARMLADALRAGRSVSCSIFFKAASGRPTAGTAMSRSR